MDIKRSNGDPNIKYYVNDSKLKLSELRDKRIIVFGERHNNEDDMALVKKLITELKPSFVLCEALGDYVLGDKLSKDLKSRSRKRCTTIMGSRNVGLNSANNSTYPSLE